MEVFFSLIGLVRFAAAISSFVLLAREFLPFLDSEDQRALRDHWKSTGGFSVWRERDRAIKHAWSEHTNCFPRSRKRALFAALLIATAVSVMFYPLWLAIGPR
jgi:hypothetical protein